MEKHGFGLDGLR